MGVAWRRAATEEHVGLERNRSPAEGEEEGDVGDVLAGEGVDEGVVVAVGEICSGSGRRR